jgi:hypothetical protein
VPVADEWDSVWELFWFDGQWGAGVWRKDGLTMEYELYDGAKDSGRLGCERLAHSAACCKRADHFPNGGLGKTFEKDARRRHEWSRASDGIGAQQFARFAAPSRYGSGSKKDLRY